VEVVHAEPRDSEGNGTGSVSAGFPGLKRRGGSSVPRLVLGFSELPQSPSARLAFRGLKDNRTTSQLTDR
jgi:hypothetical protein